MKKMIMIFCAGIAFSSCNNNGTSSNASMSDTTKKEVAQTKMNYPYTIDHPDNWEMGSNENTMNALTSLKAFENGNIDECLKYFGDSVKIQFDAIDKKVSKDTLKAMFTGSRNQSKSLSIKMYDWESVISKDKKDEWVTFWYRQSWEDLKGKKDSTDIVNDLKMKDGKIIQLDEYTRKLH